MANILIIVGALLVILSILGMVAVILEPVRHSLIIMFKREYLDDYRGDNALFEKEKKKAKSILLKICAFSFILGGVLLGSGIFLKITPRGFDSFFSENVDGASVGDGDIISLNEEDKNQNNLEEYADNSSLDTNNTDNSVYIVIEGNDISFGNTKFDNLEDFSEYFSSFDSLSKTVFLVDKYAVSKMYHDVSETLEYLGIEYEEITE